MGTWSCLPFSANQTGASWTISLAADLLEVLRGQGIGWANTDAASYQESWGVTSSPDTGYISVDGGPYIAFASLPAGFTVTALQVNAEMNFGITEPTNPGAWLCHLQWEGTDVGATLDRTTQPQLFSRTVTPTPSTLGTFFATNFGIHHDGSGGGVGLSNCRIEGAGLYISGTYEIMNYQWYLERTEEEHDGIKFEKDELTQVFDGDEPPPDAIPLGPPDVDPTFSWWEYEVDDILLYLYQVVSPGVGWTIVVAPEDYGWWKSYEEFLGGALLIVNGNPKKPRTFEEITDFSDFMGGFPGAGTVYNYKLVYAGRDYVAEPVVRIFDGLSDRELVRIPPVSGVDAVAILSMVTVNGQIYLTTIDSGDGSSDSGGPSWAGRVFRLDVASASVTLIGAQFTGGQLPYAIAWHNGMLWCGTNPAGDGSEGGKIYFFRPEVDTVWTEDHDLDTNTVGGCTGLVSYQGKLVATTVCAAAENAKVLSRAIDGTWSVIETSTGNDALNAYLSPVVYDDVLYVAKWDDTEGSFIYSYDGSTFTLEMTSDYSTHPFIGLYLGSGNIYALGGGFELPAIFYGSEDGAAWDDLTAFLPGADTQKATPVFAEVRTA